MWYRVFATVRTEPLPTAIVEHLHAQGFALEPHFKGDDLGWTSAELHFPAGGTPLLIARYLTKEDSLRADLNAYAAELETLTYSPNHLPMMERVIQTEQLITIRKPIDTPNDSLAESVCEALCQYLATELQGMYQIDGQGWFAADGTELIHEY